MKINNDDIQHLKQLLDESQYVVIGAGSGLSTSAGLEYGGKRFLDNFSEYKNKYGFNNMYSGAFHSFKTQNEFWSYFARHIHINRYTDLKTDTYKNLLRLVENKDYFVITTNCDHLFLKNGFKKDRLFYTQGDYGLFQCSEPCSTDTYDNLDMVNKILSCSDKFKCDDDAIPKCPKCGKELTTYLRKDASFVQGVGWHKACERYDNFINKVAGKKVLYLELGVGMNTPSIIKFPFWSLVNSNPNASIVSIALEDAYLPPELKLKGLSLKADINAVIEKVMNL